MTYRDLCMVTVLTLSVMGVRADAREATLLDVAAGHIPNDTGSDGQTKFTLQKHPDLGGQALKVVFAPGDSFGDRVAKVSDWKPFVALAFEAVNPADGEVALTLTLKHRRTTNYQTRVDVPIVLKPGKNSVRIGMDGLRNVNGSEPDLKAVQRWYIACAQGQTPTLYLGDLRLVGGEDAPAAKAATAGSAQAYKVRGTIGDMPVDLTVTPVTGPKSSARLTGDPARLARIRAAKMPPFAEPVEFHTPEADAVLSALEVFPPDNPWNLLVEDWPLHPNSKALIASVGADKPLRYNPDMAFILVPPGQKRVPVKIVGYPAESDKGPYPVPENVPIEGWPVLHAGRTLDAVQRDHRGGDRHAILVDPVNRILTEFFVMKRTDAGWQAEQASIFDLKTNKLRPTGWTSADAAGLPIFPAVVRYDELKRGKVEHAMRVTIRKSRRGFVPPATHFASSREDENLPRMGERFRLRRDFDVSKFSPHVRIILTGLKRYGMFVADNGIEWAISVAPDPRIGNLHAELRKVKGSDFEVVVPPSEP